MKLNSFKTIGKTKTDKGYQFNKSRVWRFRSTKDKSDQ